MTEAAKLERYLTSPPIAAHSTAAKSALFKTRWPQHTENYLA
jgi:hypothetical protein